jgi:hypothetical protein
MSQGADFLCLRFLEPLAHGVLSYPECGRDVCLFSSVLLPALCTDGRPLPDACTCGEHVAPERCVCVAIPGVPAHTTLAERRVRPWLVLARFVLLRVLTRTWDVLASVAPGRLRNSIPSIRALLS